MASSIRTAQVALLMMLVIPMAASAQRIADPAPDTLSLHERYEEMKARLMIAFWTPRLNEYRREIDRTISASDLIELNELRAQTALHIGRMHRDQEELMRQYEVERKAYEASMTENAPVGEESHADEEDADPYAALLRQRASDTSRGQNSDYYENELERLRREEWRKGLLRLERFLEGDDKALDRTDARSEYVRKINERVEAMNLRMADQRQIFAVALWLGRNYRTEIDELTGRFVADLDRYHRLLLDSTTSFLARHRAAIAGDPVEGWTITDNMLASLADAHRMLEETMHDDLPWHTSIRKVEIALLTYHGQELKDLMMLLGLPLSEWSVERLPPSTVLAEKGIDPSSDSTTIPYTLSEPATNVVLRVLDTRGAIVGTFNQGPRDMGSHTATIDLTTLAPGEYPYQLLVTTSETELLHTRIMTVVK